MGALLDEVWDGREREIRTLSPGITNSALSESCISTPITYPLPLLLPHRTPHPTNIMTIVLPPAMRLLLYALDSLLYVPGQESRHDRLPTTE